MNKLYKTKTMKKLLWLFLLFTGMVYAQPPAITTPQNQTLFDGNNDNYETFDVYTLAPQILGTLNPNDFTIRFYRDADFQSAIANGEYLTIVANTIVYVKVTENANVANFATTSFTILLVPTPAIANATNIFQMDIPFDAVGVFDLTSQSTAVLNGLTGMTLQYYPSVDAATASTNEITNPSAYTNIINPQYVCIKVTNPSTGAFSLAPFSIVLTSVETVNVPDPALLSKLIHYDTNQDGLLQVSEALSVTSLDVSNYGSYVAFSDPTGLESFTNITQINLSNNPVTSFDASVYPQLNFLWCDSTSLTSLDVHGLTNLKQINCDTGGITSLDVSTCTNLEYLFVPRQQLTSLNISGLTKIINLYCNNNHLTSLDVSLLTQMTSLCCSDNALTSLDLTGLEQIQGLCYGNQSMAPVDISHLTNLGGLYYGGGLATTLDLNTAPNLQSFWAWNSNLTELDLSGLPLVNIVRLFSNNALTYVNMKNGGQFLFSDDFMAYDSEFQSNPNLFYVCTNEADQLSVNNKLFLDTNNNGVAHAGTYCTFTPGGNYNTITGSVRFDVNNDGCDATDVQQPNIKLKLNDGTNTGDTFTDTSGAYNFYTEAGSFEITPELENAAFFNFSPATATVDFVNDTNNVTNQSFCLTANGVHPDLEIVVAPITRARPGFDAVYKLVYKNIGNQVLSGNVTLGFNDGVLDLISASQTPDLTETNLLTWNYSNLLPFENRSILITLNVNSPTETPAVNINDLLQFSVNANPVANDENTTNNHFDLNQIVLGSFDPNDILCLEGPAVSPENIGNFLHYLVSFENTGSAQTEQVVVKLEIDPEQFDVNSIQLMNTSHDVFTTVTGNIVEFKFPNINLQPSTEDPPVGGHGTVLFKIKTLNTLSAGAIVSNTANIYFDYNLPVQTNDARTTFAALSVPGFTKDESIALYPNPANNYVQIKSDSNIKQIEMFDIEGRILETIMENKNAVKLDISDKTNGIYFLRITTEQGKTVEKIIKE